MILVIHIYFSNSTTVQCSTTLGPTNHVTQTPAVSGHQNQMSIHGPQLVSSSNTGVFRQVIVTDSSGNKVHGIAGTNQSLGLTLPQKPTPPGITLVKPGFNSPSAAGKTSSGANAVLDKKSSLPTVIFLCPKTKTWNLNHKNNLVIMFAYRNISYVICRKNNLTKEKLFPES